MDRIKSALNAYIVREFMADRPNPSLGNDEALIEDGVIDSLGIFLLVAFIEQEMGVKLQPEDVILDNFRSVNTIGDLVLARQASLAQA